MSDLPARNGRSQDAGGRSSPAVPLLLATVIGVTTALGELSEPVWAVAALSLLVAVTLLGTGVALGFVRLADRRRTRVAT